MIERTSLEGSGFLELAMRSDMIGGVSLRVQQLKSAIADLAKSKGIAGARVLDKVNRYGEVVIALILPVDPPKQEK